MKSKISNTSRILLLSTALLVTACQSATTTSPKADRNDKIDAALQRAAVSSERSGYSGRSLSFLETRYKRNVDDEQAAIDYAAALRKNDYLNRASIIIAPFANDPKSSSAAKNEYAAIALAQGQYAEAEKYAQKAILQDDSNYRAFHHLGIALDAQGEHEKAERAFRKGLELWEGDPTTIMNNLALNLASQEHLDEAAEILQRAQAVSPGRREIERNLRIITALQQSNGIPVPKPGMKPNIPHNE